MNTKKMITGMAISFLVCSAVSAIELEETSSAVTSPENMNAMEEKSSDMLNEVDSIQQLNGVIESVDVKNLEIKIKNTADTTSESMSFKINEETLIQKNGSDLMVKELTPGSQVKISYTNALPGITGKFALQIYVI